MTAKDVLNFTKDMTLLYVEDDDALRASTQKMLENFFQKVDIARDGEEGLHLYLKADRIGEPYSLVITDINMPNLDGISMGESIMVHNSSQPLIFVTAHNEMNFLHSAIEMGASGFLTKPTQYEHLLKTLYRVGEAHFNKKFMEQKYHELESMYQKIKLQHEELESKNADLEKSLLSLATLHESTKI